jgi:hypothetical protein
MPNYLFICHLWGAAMRAALSIGRPFVKETLQVGSVHFYGQPSFLKMSKEALNDELARYDPQLLQTLLHSKEQFHFVEMEKT